MKRILLLSGFIGTCIVTPHYIAAGNDEWSDDETDFSGTICTNTEQSIAQHTMQSAASLDSYEQTMLTRIMELIYYLLGYPSEQQPTRENHFIDPEEGEALLEEFMDDAVCILTSAEEQVAENIIQQDVAQLDMSGDHERRAELNRHILCHHNPASVHLHAAIVARVQELVFQKKVALAARERALELASIRQRMQISQEIREEFKQGVFAYYQTLPPQVYSLLTSPLDTSKRHSLIKTVVNRHEQAWHEFIVQYLLRTNTQVDYSRLYNIFVEQWGSNQMQLFSDKRIIQQLVSMGEFCANGAIQDGCTPLLCGEILWHFWKFLCKEIATLRNVELTPDEQWAIAGIILPAQETLFELWIETAQNATVGMHNEGTVTKRFEEEACREQARIAAIKQQGADARYEDPTGKKYEQVIEGPHVTSKLTFAAHRAALAKSLPMLRPAPAPGSKPTASRQVPIQEFAKIISPDSPKPKPVDESEMPD